MSAPAWHEKGLDGQGGRAFRHSKFFPLYDTTMSMTGIFTEADIGDDENAFYLFFDLPDGFWMIPSSA